jgi:hypothetical protein
MDLQLFESERALRGCLAVHCRLLTVCSTSSTGSPERREEAAVLAREMHELGAWTEDVTEAPGEDAPARRLLESFVSRLKEHGTGRSALPGGSVPPGTRPH